MSGQRAAALLAWYRGRDRDIPWRQSSDPYLILVGEVMAQQTQASRAAAHYRRFVDRFPTVETLAAAPLSQVLELWAGLGYNSRAKRLRDSAAVVAANGWPNDLTTLPGVGPYTAAAVRCFALGEHVAVVDTNVRRVLGRWRGSTLNGDAQAEADNQLSEPAADWNQAVMDLGAAVCVGSKPHCGDCPVQQWCAGPDAYQPPAPQSRYEGSRRQARAAILLQLAAGGPRRRDELLVDGVGSEHLPVAVAGLIGDGLVIEEEGRLAVAE